MSYKQNKKLFTHSIIQEDLPVLLLMLENIFLDYYCKNSFSFSLHFRLLKFRQGVGCIFNSLTLLTGSLTSLRFLLFLIWLIVVLRQCVYSNLKVISHNHLKSRECRIIILFVLFFISPELAMAAWCYEFILLLDKYNFVHEEDTWSWSLYCYDDRDSHNLL